MDACNLLASYFNVLDNFLMVLMFPEANINPSLKFTKLFLVTKANRWVKAEEKSERNVAQKMKSTNTAVPPAVTLGCLQKWANLHRLKH